MCVSHPVFVWQQGGVQEAQPCLGRDKEILVEWDCVDNKLARLVGFQGWCVRKFSRASKRRN
jgi:hypothetical protein